MLSLACHRRLHAACDCWPICDCQCHPENEGIDALSLAQLKKLYVKHYQKMYFREWRKQHRRGVSASEHGSNQTQARRGRPKVKVLTGRS